MAGGLIVDVAQWDAIRFDKNTMRAVEAGPDGVGYVAFGAGDDPGDAELVANWWGSIYEMFTARCLRFRRPGKPRVVTRKDGI